MNSTGRSSSRGLKKRGIHEAEPHNNDEDDNKIVKKKKVFDGDDEGLVSIQGGTQLYASFVKKLTGAFRSGTENAKDVNNKPILVNGKPVKVKVIVTTSMLATAASMVVVAGGAHATQYLAKIAIDGFFKTSTGGLLALPVISDIVNVLVVDTTGSLIQHGVTEPIHFLINLVVGDQYRDYYSSIFQINKHTYCTNRWKDQLKSAIIFSVEGNEMINFLSPSVQLIGKVVGNLFIDFFTNLIKKLEGFEMMRNYAGEILKWLYDLLGKFFAGVYTDLKKALLAFAKKLSKQALNLYVKVEFLFRNIVLDAVNIFTEFKNQSSEILNKFVSMVKAGIKKVTDLQLTHKLILKDEGKPGDFRATASKPTDAYLNEAEEEVSKTISFNEIDPDLAIELSELSGKARDEAVSEYQSDVIGRSEMFGYLAKWVFGGVQINWINPSALTHLNPKEKAYLQLKNAWLLRHFGGHDELRAQLKKEGSLIV